MRFSPSKFKKSLVAIVLVCFLFTAVLGAFLIPRPVEAQLVTHDPVSFAYQTGKGFWDTLWRVTQAMVFQTVFYTAYNTLQRFAYNTALSVANIGREGSMFNTKTWGKMWDDTKDYARDEFLSQAAGGFEQLTGLDMCNPAEPDISLSIRMGLQSRYTPKKPKCEYGEIKRNWGEFKEKMGSAETYKAIARNVFGGTAQSDLSIAWRAGIMVEDKVSLSRYLETKEMEYDPWIKSGKNIVSGRIETPAGLMKEEIKDLQKNLKKDELREIQITSLFMNTDNLAQAGLGLAQTFVNTLLSTSLERGMKGLMDLLKPKEKEPNLGSEEQDWSGTRKTKQAMEAVAGELFAPQVFETTSFDPLADFSVCSPEIQGQNHCVIDQQFAAAVRNPGAPLTVREAMDQGLLRGDWPFISSSDKAKNQSNECYGRGYCYSNLVKLRRARILPVGWELAAELSPVGNELTLNDVVDAFYNDCTEGPSSENPCRLVDPNWVLKLPSTQCRAKAYGQTLLSPEGNRREEICVDTPSCILDDAAGNCEGGYGYCTREKNIWRINADACPSYFNTCQSFTATLDNKKVSYLKNTLDFNGCTSLNAGCRQYSRGQNPPGTWDPAEKIYFNRNAEICDQDQVGCGEFIRKRHGVAYNLIKNASFEKDEDNNNVPDNWTDIGAYGDDSVRGRKAVQNRATQRGLELEYGIYYTLSVYAKKTTDSVIGGVVLEAPLDFAHLYTNCDIREDVGAGITGRAGILLENEELGESYSRFSCFIRMPSGPQGTTISADMMLGRIGDSGNILFDAVQLEEGSEAASFREQEEGYGDVERVNLKAPPDYLGCTGDEGEPSECANYAAVCRADEVGCEQYTPRIGEPPIPGIVSREDICPVECVGYQTWKQEPTLYDLTKSEHFPLYFIPDTATSCSAAEVGCDEFTNLETEAREYYTYLRPCILPGPNEATYYTWEGSDTTGYQLKSWKLKRGIPLNEASELEEDLGFDFNNDGDIEDTWSNWGDLNGDGDTSDTEPGSPPAYVKGTDPRLCAKDIFELSLGQEGYNPDCREFYDTAGNISYRLYTKTVVSTNACANYRKTESTQTDCLGSGGVWNPAIGECAYWFYPQESVSCSARAKGCRAYTGSASANMQTIMEDGFLRDSEEWQGGSLSSEALKQGDKSFKAGPMAQYTLTKDVSTSTPDLSTPIHQGGTYTLSFWAKGTAGAFDVKFTTSPETMIAQNVALRPDWRYYTFGPIEIGADAVVSEGTGDISDGTYNFDGTALQISNSGTFYLDNVILREVVDHIYKIKNSWNTPASCDRTVDGVLLPQAMLGCEAYTDRAGGDQNLKSFSKLCREKSVGCEAWIDTQNTESLKAEVWSMGVELLTVPADQTVYLVNDTDKYCQEANIGCSALGLAELDFVPANPVFEETRYLKNQPANYGETLCQNEFVGCEEYATDRSVFYFKNPGKKLCEFKENVTIEGRKFSGWFKKGTNIGCYPETDANPYIIGGNFYGIWKNKDVPQFLARAGECPTAQSGCEEFVDPEDTSPIHPEGEPYYYLNNDKIRGLRAECAGGVSQKEGCVLFDQTSNTQKTYSTDVSYFWAEKKKERTPAVDCELEPGKCNNACSGAGALAGAPCETDLDCPKGDGTYGICQSAAAGSEFKNNANLILNANRDRKCGEWLECSTYVKVWDEKMGKERIMCTNLSRCNEELEGGGCQNWLLGSDEFLTASAYAGRDVSWKGMEYSGYAIPGMTGLEYIWESGLSQDPASCRGYPEPDAPFPARIAQWDTSQGYGQIKTKTQGFRQANVCEWGWEEGAQGEPQNCECSYKKVTYGVEPKYFEFKETDYPLGICMGGPRAGLPCDPNKKYSEGLSKKQKEKTCGPPESGGQCSSAKKVEPVLGWKGYCLEWDKSHPINGTKNEFACQTWLPIDIIPGETDIFSEFEAGYTEKEPLYYCLQAKGNYDATSQSYSPLRMVRISLDVGPSFFHTRWNSMYIPRFNLAANISAGATSLTISGNQTGKLAPEDKIFIFGPGAIESRVLTSVVYTTFTTLSWNDGLENAYTTSDYIEVSYNKTYRMTGGNLSLSLLENTLANIRVDGKIWGGNVGTGAGGNRYEDYEVEEILAQTTNWSRLDFKKGDNGWWYLIGTKRNCAQPTIDSVDWGSVGRKVDSLACDKYNLSHDCHDFIIMKFKLPSVDAPDGKMAFDACNYQGDNEDLDIDFTFKLREPCRVIAQVSDGIEDRAWTDRVWKDRDPGYQVTNVGTDLDYSYLRPAPPFGSAVPRVLDVDTSWYVSPEGIDGDPAFPEGGYDAGSPYGCWEDGQCAAISPSAPYDQSPKNKLQELFAKFYNIYEWNESQYRYSQILTTWQKATPLTEWDITDTASEAEGPEIENITLNNRTSGNVGNTETPQITLRFFAYNANGNQMPLRKIVVNWGDGERTTLEGHYKNRKSECRDSDDPLYNFGDSPVACVEEPFTFIHTYLTCRIATDDRDGDGTPDSCIFYPKIWVKDNWDRCSKDVYGSGGECPSAAWVNFPGQVVVLPSSQVGRAALSEDALNQALKYLRQLQRVRPVTPEVVLPEWECVTDADCSEGYFCHSEAHMCFQLL